MSEAPTSPDPDRDRARRDDWWARACLTAWRTRAFRTRTVRTYVRVGGEWVLIDGVA